ncbi:Family S53 protease-like protein [Mycena venus]|uniref:tripeptidyl-peptidase II n=1 Tax=Mycena venus TaxID=2733690 RepID=A0A8H6XZ13_9AGAR|nr:Family S53 protease-like protein [Mycena venus]
MAFSALLRFLSLVAAVSARDLVLHERRSMPPAGFLSQGFAPASEMLTLRVALAPNNVAGLQDKLMSVSSPGSSDFRQWLSIEEVKSYVQPSSETVGAFNSFASANGLKPTIISPNGDWVSITLPVSQANDIFAANFEKFTHKSLTQPITRTLSVSLPSELVGHVEVIHPTTAFTWPTPRRAASIASVPLPRAVNVGINDVRITPSCLQDLYNIPATPATSPNNSILVTGYIGFSAQLDQLGQFLQLTRPDMPANTSFSLVSINGGVIDQGPDVLQTEANLDVQYTVGVATGVPVTFLSVGGLDADFASDLLDTTNYLDGLEILPTVMTTSYDDDESAFGESMAKKICNGYMALGARGMSVIFSSGDGGARGQHDDISECTNNTFTPTFPSTCPYLTAIGGTEGFGPEVGVDFSSGGFSNYFPAPAYQSSAISSFFATLPTNFNGTFNRTGRGFPDLAAQALLFTIISSGNKTEADSGTSASAPTVASIIALINDKLLSVGKPVLGFLNPWLYASATKEGFTDITEGSNPGLVCFAPSAAFDAVDGWDPVTGLGTPLFDKLLAAAMA